MPITTLSSREFSQNTGRAKKAAQSGPVFITDRGRQTHVLLSIEEYRRLQSKGMNIAEALAMSAGGEDFEFDPPRLRDIARPADLS